MNKKRKSFKVMMLALCIIALMVIFQSPQAMATTSEVNAEAYNLEGLLIAIEQASDGDVIGIKAAIIIPSDAVIGNSDKHITIRRIDSSARFVLGIADNIRFQNITLDGNGISSSYQLVESSDYSSFSVIFEDVKFENCISSYHGAAALINHGTALFKNCTFSNNSSTYGGHLAVLRNANVDIENCTFINGDALAMGGAIYVASNTSTCNIKSSTITNNNANIAGGGVANNGVVNIENTKLFNNTASKGGSDVLNLVNGQSNLLDSLEELQELFSDYEFNPIGWVRDYEEGVEIHDVDTSREDALLKLEFEERIVEPTEVVLEAESLGIASDSKVTGLESGKYYMVTMGDIISYSKADGTLTPNEPESEVLLGTEIIGLINGEIYKVEEYTPAPVEEEPIDEPDEEEPPIEEPEEPKEEEPEPQPEEPPVKEEPIEDDEPTPEEPIEEEPVIKDPEPVKPPTSSSDRPRRNSSPVVKKEEPAPIQAKPAVVLSNGKAILDTTKTEYLLGYTDGLLGSKGTVTKAELAQIVYRLLTPESKADIYSEKNNFKDVSSNDWYNEAVSTLTNAGLISMGADGKFNPDKNITWGEMITIFSKFAKPNHEWKIITKHWARDSINTAISYRWFEYNDQFNPDDEVTRLEMLNFINTLFDWAEKQ